MTLSWLKPTTLLIYKIDEKYYLVVNKRADDAEHGRDDKDGEQDADGQTFAGVTFLVVGDVGGAAFACAAATADAKSGKRHDDGHQDAADGNGCDADVLQKYFRPVFL